MVSKTYAGWGDGKAIARPDVLIRCAQEKFRSFAELMVQCEP